VSALGLMLELRRGAPVVKQRYCVRAGSKRAVGDMGMNAFFRGFRRGVKDGTSDKAGLNTSIRVGTYIGIGAAVLALILLQFMR